MKLYLGSIFSLTWSQENVVPFESYLSLLADMPATFSISFFFHLIDFQLYNEITSLWRCLGSLCENEEVLDNYHQTSSWKLRHLFFCFFNLLFVTLIAGNGESSESCKNEHVQSKYTQHFVWLKPLNRWIFEVSNDMKTCPLLVYSVFLNNCPVFFHFKNIPSSWWVCDCKDPLKLNT